MKRDTLFFHKKTTMTCEKNMGDANEYWKLLEPQWQPKIIKDLKKGDLICGKCKKLGNTKECCH
jgi:hypothetical protein